MIAAARYTDPKATTSALVLHVRIPGQRWYHLACFGRLGHYYEDGGCEHTDAVADRLTDYGKKVTKLQPFGNGKRKPKQFAKRVEAGW